MQWTTLLTEKVEQTYAATEGLMDRVDKCELDWKPATGENWMTTGQLLMHLAEACGKCVRGLVTGDWGMPEGMDMSDAPPENMPTVSSVAEAKELLAADKAVALAMIGQTGDDGLANTLVPAPWDPTGTKIVLGVQILGMVGHLSQHKDQLFYYLKLQGHPVNTHSLYGM
jgi:hypothetical protein